MGNDQTLRCSDKDAFLRNIELKTANVQTFVAVSTQTSSDEEMMATCAHLKNFMTLSSTMAGRGIERENDG